MVLSFVAMRRFLIGVVILAAGRADAAIVLTATETGAGVTIAGSGTLNLAGLAYQGVNSSVTFSGVIPSGSYTYLIVGAVSSTNRVNLDTYTGVTGPTSFGTSGVLTTASTGSGNTFGFFYVPGSSVPNFYVPAGYTSGSILSATSTFAGATFASLGITRGTYTYTLPSDTFTFQVGPAAVPEPSSLALCGVAGLASLGIARVRRRLA